MKEEYHLSAIQKIRVKQEKERKLIWRLQQNKIKKKRMYKRRRRIAFIVLVILLSMIIYGVNLLFNDSTKSNALEMPKVTEEAPKKEIKLEEKDTKVIQAVVTQVSSEVVTEPVEPVETVEPVQPIQPIEATIYNENIPMPKDHQEYLYELCQERGLDYHKTLAVIQHESVFDANATNETNDYGYFQVNLVNHEHLAKKLHTDNSPLNPYINMNWGTYMLADLYSYWGEKGYTGNTLDEVVWSSYNKGIGGFKKSGHATEYVYKMKASIQNINEVF